MKFYKKFYINQKGNNECTIFNEILKTVVFDRVC